MVEAKMAARRAITKTDVIHAPRQPKQPPKKAFETNLSEFLMGFSPDYDSNDGSSTIQYPSPCNHLTLG
jgi:hypothetical protein